MMTKEGQVDGLARVGLRGIPLHVTIYISFYFRTRNARDDSPTGVPSYYQ